MTRRRAARYAAPLAFLAAITVAVLLVRSTLQNGSAQTSPASATLTRTTNAHKQEHAKPKAPRTRYHRVESGETFSEIAQKLGTTVVRLEQLNPGIDPASLYVGERIRVK